MHAGRDPGMPARPDPSTPIGAACLRHDEHATPDGENDSGKGLEP